MIQRLSSVCAKNIISLGKVQNIEVMKKATTSKKGFSVFTALYLRKQVVRLRQRRQWNSSRSMMLIQIASEARILLVEKDYYIHGTLLRTVPKFQQRALQQNKEKAEKDWKRFFSAFLLTRFIICSIINHAMQNK